MPGIDSGLAGPYNNHITTPCHIPSQLAECQLAILVLKYLDLEPVGLALLSPFISVVG